MNSGTGPLVRYSRKPVHGWTETKICGLGKRVMRIQIVEAGLAATLGASLWLCAGCTEEKVVAEELAPAEPVVQATPEGQATPELESPAEPPAASSTNAP